MPNPERRPVRLADLAPQDAVLARVDGELVDLAREVPGTGEVAFLGPGDADALHVLRHSAAHVLAQAVLREFPDAKYAIGPAVEDAFYYDFDLPRALTDDDIPVIEAHMRDIVASDQPFVRDEVPKDEAIRLFTDFDQPYKREILTGRDEEGQVKVGEVATLYRNADVFTDLCLGPHVPSTGVVKHVKLLRVSGAYWRGDVRRPQLQRLFGTAWFSQEDLDAYLERLDEAERRDHRTIGRDLDLFSFPPELGAGILVWHQKGGMLRQLVEDFSREQHLERGYDIVASPHIGKSVLWETSGHLEKFADKMYPPVQAEEGDYYLKPMNCPFHVLIYRARTRSYRDLPLRFFELGTVYRHEPTGTLHGIMRPRGFTQDDSHIFCRPDQLIEELLAVMQFTVDLYRPYGLVDPVVHLSTKPGTAIGTPEMWELAEQALRDALDQSPFSYDVAEGEGAFYGPKIDFDYRDAMGRLRQLTTIQVDFALPERFGLDYIGADNTAHRPVMIHRALYGSVERFLGVLIEHNAGHFPPWVAPVQVRVIAVNDSVVDQANELAATVRAKGFRVDVDDASESINYKVRRGTLERIPWMLVYGPKDIAAGTVSVRTRRGTDRRGVSLDEFLQDALRTIEDKSLDVE